MAGGTAGTSELKCRYSRGTPVRYYTGMSRRVISVKDDKQIQDMFSKLHEREAEATQSVCVQGEIK